MQYKLCVTVEA